MLDQEKALKLVREREFQTQTDTSGSYLDACWEALAMVLGNRDFWTQIRCSWEDVENRPPYIPDTAEEMMGKAVWPNHVKVVAIGDSGSAVYRKVSSGWKHRSVQSEINQQWSMYGGELIWHTHPGKRLSTWPTKSKEWEPST